MTGLMGHSFMPGGTVGHFKKGRAQYDMFLAKLNSPTDAAILLLNWSKALTDAKLVPSFGGYFGKDGERPAFVFTKGAWITGIVGLPQKQADAEARVLASRIEKSRGASRPAPRGCAMMIQLWTGEAGAG